MPWDFSTEPEFRAKLDWMREFVRERDLAAGDADRRARAATACARAIAAAAGGGPGAGPVGRASRPRARRPGLRPGQARADARDPRQQPDRAAGVRQRRRRTRATRRSSRSPARPSRRSGICIRCWPATCAVRVQHDRARHRRLGPDAAADARGARRRRVGDQRPQVVHLQRLDRRLPDRDGGHRSRGAAAPARLDVHRRRRHARGRIVRDVATMEHPYDSFGRYGNHAEILYEDVRVPADALLGAAGRRLPDRPAAPVPGPHPSLHALARGGPPGVRHALRAVAVPLRARRRRCPSTRPSRTGSPTPRPRCRRRG